MLDCSSTFNIIMERRWIHSMKVVPSTYHQRIRFPTANGVIEIRGSQSVSRSFYLSGIKLTRKCDMHQPPIEPDLLEEHKEGINHDQLNQPEGEPSTWSWEPEGRICKPSGHLSSSRKIRLRKTPSVNSNNNNNISIPTRYKNYQSRERNYPC